MRFCARSGTSAGFKSVLFSVSSWPRVPFPKVKKRFRSLVDLGRKLAELEKFSVAFQPEENQRLLIESWEGFKVAYYNLDEAGGVITLQDDAGKSRKISRLRTKDADIQCGRIQSCPRVAEVSFLCLFEIYLQERRSHGVIVSPLPRYSSILIWLQKLTPCWHHSPMTPMRSSNVRNSRHQIRLRGGWICNATRSRRLNRSTISLVCG